MVMMIGGKSDEGMILSDILTFNYFLTVNIKQKITSE